MATRPIKDTKLVTYLRAKQFPETERPKLIKNSVTFFFEETPELRNEIEAFLNQETTVEPIALLETLHIVRSLIAEFKKGMKIGGDLHE